MGLEYKIIFETTAARDLRDIFEYIMYVLKQPEIAKRILLTIEEQVMKLGQMPARHSIVRDEPYAALGVRMLPIEKYAAFYIIDEAAHEVHVLRILYNRREWQRLL
jgi:toxin ParE1/3/4